MIWEQYPTPKCSFKIKLYQYFLNLANTIGIAEVGVIFIFIVICVWGIDKFIFLSRFMIRMNGFTNFWNPMVLANFIIPFFYIYIAHFKIQCLLKKQKYHT